MSTVGIPAGPVTTADPVGGGDHPDWSLATAARGPLVVRLGLAAVLAAAVGGTATAWMSLAFANGSGRSPIAWTLVVEMPLVLIGLIVARLALTYGRAPWAPSGAWLTAVASASVVLITVIQFWPEIEWSGRDLPHDAAFAAMTGLVGTVCGMIPAGASLAVLVPGLLLLHAGGVRLSRADVQLVVTLVPMVVTAAIAPLILTQAPGEGAVAAMATALTGTGAVLGARWIVR